MLTIIGDIPNLNGCLCDSLIKQEFWLDGQKESDINVLFLKVQNHKWQRFFFDSGTLFWNQVDFLDFWDMTPNDQFHYPQREIGHSSGLIGSVVEKIECNYRNPVWNLTILFSSEKRLILNHWYYQKDEGMELEFG